MFFFQDTLIVWSEADNYDLALSFQEKAGCEEIWERICQVQGKDPSVDITQDIVEESEDERFDEMSESAPPIELPPCELSRLEEINDLIGNCLSSPARKEKLAQALESEGYIRKLLNLFHACEDLENIEGILSATLTFSTTFKHQNQIPHFLISVTRFAPLVRHLQEHLSAEQERPLRGDV